MARLQATRVQFDVAVRETLELTQAAIVATARREHAKVMAADPRPGSFRRYVDGREGAPEESVKADGVILYDYERIESVVQFAMETLFDLSPVLSGDYRQGHMLFVDGAAAAGLADWKPGSEVIITNLVPYSRKVELGVMKMRVPGTDHVYAQAQRIVMRRMGNLARVRFTYRTVTSPGRSGIGRVFHSRKGVRVRVGGTGPRGSTRTVDDSKRMPALLITDR